MEYYFVLCFMLVASVTGESYRVKYVQPYQLIQPPIYHSYNPYIYQHAPVQIVSKLPAVAEGKTAAVGAYPGVAVVSAAAPDVATVKSSILTGQPQQSTTLIENAQPVVQVLNTPFYQFISGVQKPVEAKVKAGGSVHLTTEVVEADTVVQDPLVSAVAAGHSNSWVPAPLTPGYVAITPGATHQAALPVGPSGDGFFASHHINLPQDIQTKVSRKRRSAHYLASINPGFQYAHRYPTYANYAPAHSIAYPYQHVYYTPAIDTPSVKAAPTKTIVSPIISAPFVSSPVLANVLRSPVVQVPKIAPGYVAVNPGATHRAPLPIGPSGDGFYASHHVNLQ